MTKLKVLETKGPGRSNCPLIELEIMSRSHGIQSCQQILTGGMRNYKHKKKIPLAKHRINYIPIGIKTTVVGVIEHGNTARL